MSDARRWLKACGIGCGFLLLLAGLTRFEGFALIFLVLTWIWMTGFPRIGGASG